jgi:acyl-CoA thioester hydrolase
MAREQHFRFPDEVLAGEALVMRGCVLDMDESEARLLLVLFAATTGEPVASVRLRVAHVTPLEAQPFPWSAGALACAAALTTTAPTYGAPSGLTLPAFTRQASTARADALGFATTAAGAAQPQDCDVFGRLRAERLVGRISEAAGRLVDCRIAHLGWPAAGDRLVVRSGAVAGGMIHWVLDPRTGAPWAVVEVPSATPA